MPIEWEHIEQTRLFNWAEEEASRFPELAMMYANANGGYRTKRTAAKMKDEGIKAGVPDITIAAPRGNFHGFYIELKAIYPDGKKGKVSDEQKAWIKALRERGYKAEVYWGWRAAADAITEYLEGA